jgi:hypothetical protein
MLSAASPLAVTCKARRVRSIAVTAITVLAMAATALFAPSASAAPGDSSETPGDFSSRVLVAGPNPITTQVDDCVYEVGIVFDSVPYPNYRHVGGVRVNCGSTQVIDATVTLWYFNKDTNDWDPASSQAFPLSNSPGSGDGIDGILQAPPVCANGYRTSWTVTTTVRTDRGDQNLRSGDFPDPPEGGC